jgi:hypothetical protein
MSAMPQPGDEHRLLHRFAGRWEGPERLSPSPWGPGGVATGRFESRVALGGFFVVQDYAEEKGGRLVFEGHGLLGYDAATGEVAWTWADSMGFVPDAPARGRWQQDGGGDTLVLLKRTPRGSGRYTFRFEGADTHHFRIENSFDGEKTWTLFMEGTYHRTGGAA